MWLGNKLETCTKEAVGQRGSREGGKGSGEGACQEVTQGGTEFKKSF